MLQRRHRRLSGITFAPPLRKKRIAQISVAQAVALQQSANADCSVAVRKCNGPEAVAVLGLAGMRPVSQVALGVRKRVNVAVSDEAEPGGVVEEGENERGVVEGEGAEGEAMGAEYDVAAAAAAAAAIGTVCTAAEQRRNRIAKRGRRSWPNFLVHFSR